ncbi:MAG: WD40 repeat domain-containing protein [Chloroflexota bacterium]
MKPNRPSPIRLSIQISLILISAFLLLSCNHSKDATSTSNNYEAISTPMPAGSESPNNLLPTDTSTALQATTEKPPHPVAKDLNPKHLMTLGKGLTGDLVYSPDGKLFATLEKTETGNSILRWLNTATGEELGVAPPDYRWISIEGFSNDSRWLLASKSMFGGVAIDTTSGEIRECCDNGVADFRFSTDGRYIVYVGDVNMAGDPQGCEYIGVYPLTPDENFPLVQDIYEFPDYSVLNPEGSHRMTDPVVSTDNYWLAAGYSDPNHNLLYVWDFKTGAEKFSITYPAKIYGLDFSPDGRYVAVGGGDGVLRLYTVSTGEIDRTVTGFTNRINNVRFNADGSQIIVSVHEQLDQVYDLTSEQTQPVDMLAITPAPFVAARYLDGYADGSSVLFSPDGKTMAVGSQSVQLWNVESQAVSVSIENPYGPLLGWAFNNNGSQLAGMTKTGSLLIWDTANGELLFTVGNVRLEGGVMFSDLGTEYGLSFSPDNTQIAFSNDGAIEIWDIATNTLVNRMEQPTLSITTRVSFSADGKRLYAVTNRNREPKALTWGVDSAQIWDVSSGQLFKQFDLPIAIQVITGTTLQGSFFARNYGDYNKKYWIELWNLESGEMFVLSVPDGWDISPLRFSPDGSLLFAKSHSTLYFWKTTTGALLHSMPLEIDKCDIAVSSDGTTLAIGRSGQVELWNILGIRDAAAQPGAPTTTP